jgi:Xaa-Pro aminopeptidase
LEQPQLNYGNRTPLESGVVFTVDSGITAPEGIGARVGNTVK